MAFETPFIGREDELYRLRHDVFFVSPNSTGSCYSLVGLNGIGKTTLIRKISEEFNAARPANAFLFSTDITAGITFWTFWARLVLKFSKSITRDVLTRAAAAAGYDNTDEIMEIYDFFRENMAFTETPELRSQAIIYLSDLFPRYSEMRIRIILTIDEFDRAQSVFPDGQFFQFLFGLTPKGTLTALDLSIMTISRRRVCTIAHDMQEGSNFEDGFPPLVLKGFNVGELDEYFRTYEQLPCGPLPEEARKEILYLCGRSPGLLMRLRHEFEVMREPRADIGWIYAEHGQFIKTAYDRMITLMKGTYADRAQKKTLLEVFIQKFIGPAYDDNFDVELPLLYDYGFVMKGTAENNIFSLSGMPLQDEGRAESVIYEPIAPYFVEYVKHTVLSEELSVYAGLLTRAETLIRKIIQKEMCEAYPENWEEQINRYAGKKDYYLESLQVKALQNDFSSGSISKLNVISFKEYYYIISDHWSIFSKYFTKYSGKSALFSAMSLLSEGRNDSAHLNLVVYNGESRRRLRETCSFFISCLEDPSEIQPIPAAGSDGAPVPTDAQIAELTGRSAAVTFCCQAIKLPKRNLRGIIKGCGFPAGVAQRNLAAFRFEGGHPQIGDEFPAMVERWDSNAGMFNLRAPEPGEPQDPAG